MPAALREIEAMVLVWAREMSRKDQEILRLKNHVKALEKELGYVSFATESIKRPAHEPSNP